MENHRNPKVGNSFQPNHIKIPNVSSQVERKENDITVRIDSLIRKIDGILTK